MGGNLEGGAHSVIVVLLSAATFLVTPLLLIRTVLLDLALLIGVVLLLLTPLHLVAHYGAAQGASRAADRRPFAFAKQRPSPGPDSGTNERSFLTCGEGLRTTCHAYEEHTRQYLFQGVPLAL